MGWSASLSDVYFYLVFMLMFCISAAIIRDRKLFPARSSGMLLLLSSLLAFFGGYLLIRSLAGGHRYGSGTCGPEGCTYSQPLLFTIDGILFMLLFPLLLFTALTALLMVLAEIRRPKTDRLMFDGAGIVLAGGLLFLFAILGGYPGLRILGPVFLIPTLVLLSKSQRYKSIFWAVS